MRPLLQNIVSPFQASFVPRWITENPIIAQEIIHSMKEILNELKLT